jgi:hypothetical protein
VRGARVCARVHAELRQGEACGGGGAAAVTCQPWGGAGRAGC